MPRAQAVGFDPAQLDAIVFDLDDTLLDWRAAEARAIAGLIEGPLRGIGVTNGQVTTTYAAILAENLRLFHATRQWLYVRDRLRLLVERLGVAERVDAEAVADHFSRDARAHLRMLDGALEALAAARRNGRKVALLTNGPTQVQRPKVEAFRLAGHVDHVAISGEIGLWKPEAAAFQHVLDLLGSDAKRTLMVGDSLDFDIRPARSLGMPTAWVDPSGAPHADADVTVRTPRELARLLS